MTFLRKTDADGARWLRWALRVRLVFGPLWWRSWFKNHGWPAGHELVPVEWTTRGCVPGLRQLVGQTYHLGPLKLLFGREQTAEHRRLIDAWCRYGEVVEIVLSRGKRDGLDEMRTHWALVDELRHRERVDRERRNEAAQRMN